MRRNESKENATKTTTTTTTTGQHSDVAVIRKAYTTVVRRWNVAAVLHRTLTLRYRRLAATTLSRSGLSFLFRCTLSPLAASLSHFLAARASLNVKSSSRASETDAREKKKKMARQRIFSRMTVRTPQTTLRCSLPIWKFNP